MIRLTRAIAVDFQSGQVPVGKVPPARYGLPKYSFFDTSMWLSAIVLDHDENREDDNSKDGNEKKCPMYSIAYPYPDGRVRWLGRGSTPFLLG